MMDCVLASKQSGYTTRLELLEERRKSLEEKRKEFEAKKEQDLRHIQELDAQIERYKTIAKEIKAQNAEKDKIIDELKIQLKSLQKQKESVQKKQKQCEVHQFIQNVIDNSNQEFKHPKDVVIKFQSLSHILKELNLKQVTCQDSVANEKAKIVHFVENARVEIFKLHSSIEQLKESVFLLQTRIHTEERKFQEFVIDNTKREVQFQQKKMSILNMVNIICKRMNLQLKTTDSIEQLTKIQHYLNDLNSIVTELTTDGQK